ncbi:1938_t:CDS:1, partial [Paraglomus occultum]
EGLTPKPYCYEIPEPGERFEYIVVEGENYYDNNNRKIPWKKGNYMEFPDVAKKLNKKIDISYYLKSVVGLCARFINNSKCFEPQPDSESLKNITDPDELWTAKDGIAQESAERWLKKYIKDLRDAPKKEEAILSHLWEEVNTYAEKTCSSNDVNRTMKARVCLNYSYHIESGARDFTSAYLNALSGIESSIRLNLSDLFTKISNFNEEYRNDLYKLVIQSHKHKSDISILEKYILSNPCRISDSLNCELMKEFRNEWCRGIALVTVRRRALSHLTTQNTEADLDEIIDLYY